ncbi:MAG: hypothetical protein EAZ08_05050 [Cytophagales bacterium]|nr:MAG: hypothetical protein EAZ08_05050 [Cytophagales bacterium]
MASRNFLVFYLTFINFDTQKANEPYGKWLWQCVPKMVRFPKDFIDKDIHAYRVSFVYNR